MAKSDLDPDLLVQAGELNIEVTDAATNETLKAAIDEVLAEDGAVDIGELRAAYKAATGKKPFGGWDAAELQKRMAASGEPKPAKQPKTVAQTAKVAPALVAVSVKRDFWTANPADPDNPIRHESGSVVEVSVDAAMDGIEAGVLSRVR